MQSESLIIHTSPQYSGLSILRGSQKRFTWAHIDPLYKFPVISSKKASRVFMRSDFTCPDSIDESLAILEARSPFKHSQSSISSELSAQVYSKKIESYPEDFSLSLESDEVVYNPGTEELSEFDWDDHAIRTSEEAFLTVSQLQDSHPMAELAEQTEEPSDEEPCAFDVTHRQFLKGTSASKSKLIETSKPQIDPPDLSSPLLRKLVICQENPISKVEILYSFPGIGFAASPSLEYSDAGRACRGFVSHSSKDHSLVALLSNIILKECSAYSVAFLSCGYEHIAAVTNSGKVLSWGCGNSGCLGHGDLSTYKRPSFVVGLIDEVVLHLECGGYHTVAVTDTGHVFSWGRNDGNQLGIDSDVQDPIGKVALTPVKLPLSQAKAVACGEAHTLVLDSTGNLMAFGWAEQGQLGTDDSYNNSNIQKIQLPFKVVKASAGAVFSACLSEFGSLYVWGNGEQGQLGLGAKVYRTNRPALVGDLKGETVVDFACGESHVFCITSDARIYGWGKGIVGRFEDYLHFPRGSEVVSFSPKRLEGIDIAHRFIVV